MTVGLLKTPPKRDTFADSGGDWGLWRKEVQRHWCCAGSRSQHQEANLFHHLQRILHVGMFELALWELFKLKETYGKETGFQNVQSLKIKLQKCMSEKICKAWYSVYL